MPAPSASGFDLLCRNTTIATADRQQTNATTITALVVARMPKFIVGPQPVGTSRVFPQPARRAFSFTALRKPRLYPDSVQPDFVDQFFKARIVAQRIKVR